MTIGLYATLDGADTRFDGRRAQEHLVNKLAMTPAEHTRTPQLASAFARWPQIHDNTITLHPSGPILLLPPSWY